MRRGFTLIELLTVIAIIAVLIGLGIPGYQYMQRRAKLSATQGVVLTIAAAVSAYSQRHLLLYAEDSRATYRAWDIDNDGIIDGTNAPLRFWGPPPPAGTPAADAQRENLRYRGLYATVRPDLSARHIDAGTGQIIDAWRRPLRIAWSTTLYGDQGFGIWSAGPDGVDAPSDDLGDDLRSWTRR